MNFSDESFEHQEYDNNFDWIARNQLFQSRS